MIAGAAVSQIDSAPLRLGSRSCPAKTPEREAAESNDLQAALPSDQGEAVLDQVADANRHITTLQNKHLAPRQHCSCRLCSSNFHAFQQPQHFDANEPGQDLQIMTDPNHDNRSAERRAISAFERLSRILRPTYLQPGAGDEAVVSPE